MNPHANIAQGVVVLHAERPTVRMAPAKARGLAARLLAMADMVERNALPADANPVALKDIAAPGALTPEGERTMVFAHDGRVTEVRESEHVRIFPIHPLPPVRREDCAPQNDLLAQMAQDVADFEALPEAVRRDTEPTPGVCDVWGDA